MHPDRKKKLKKREEKQCKVEARRNAILDRTLNFMGLQAVFDRLPDSIHEFFLRIIPPGMEVVATDDSVDDPEIKRALREMTAIVKRPLCSVYLGREFELALEDLYRGYESVAYGVGHLLHSSRDPQSRLLRSVRPLMQEAKETIDKLDQHWVRGVFAQVCAQISDVVDATFRIDGRMMLARVIPAHETEGGTHPRIELRIVTAKPKVVYLGGSQWTVFPCCLMTVTGELRQTKWNCKDLGIEGPKTELPVFIAKHAIARLHERLPLFDPYDCMLDHVMVACLESPVLIPRQVDSHLVEVCLGKHRVGYFVAQILPHLVLIKTFLFLTMHGTPEAERLREKLGLDRGLVESYKLDRFDTLVASDIANDPLLSRVLSECGCGHLLALGDLEYRSEWLESFGERMKRSFEIREARDGFMVGHKWFRWSDRPPGPQ